MKGRELDAWSLTTCNYCNKEFKTRTYYLKRGQMKYCSHKCSAEARKKYKTYSYLGTIYYFNKATGYYEYPNTKKKLHREIYKHHKGDISEGYVVHHVDGNKTNNHISNLELMEWAEHTSYHNSISSKKKDCIIKQCSENGCNRNSKAKGLCTKHYQRMKAKERGYWL